MCDKEYIERGALLKRFAELHDGGNWLVNDYNADWIHSFIETAPAADVVEVPNGRIGEISDGYHTFDELYHHRAILFSVICNSMSDKAWKSKLHDTGDMYDGMFIVGIETPEGQATYHYDIEPYWDMFKVKELEKAPKWDGHTPQIAIERMEKLSADVVSRGVFEQVKWERDMAMQQLEEHGIPFGGEADDVVNVVRCKDCKHAQNMPLGLCYLHTEPYDNARGYKGDAVCVEPYDFCSCGERKEQT